MNLAQYVPKTLNFQLGNVAFSPSLIQAGLIILLLFVLVLTLAQVRRHFIDWALKGILPGIFFGFLFALILEGFLIVGGRTAVTEILGWKNAPTPVLSLIDIGRARLTAVLGVTSQIPSSTAKEKSSVEKVIEGFQSLSPKDAKSAKSLICNP